MSAPSSAGDVNKVSASKSLAMMISALLSCACWHKSLNSLTEPLVSGYWSNTPNTSSQLSTVSLSSNITNSIPSGVARVRKMSKVCGWQYLDTRHLFFLPFDARCASVNASPAAVPSSSNDALATSNPVNSVIMVWK